MIGLYNFKDKKANNIITSLAKSKEVDFYRFLFALGIAEVGVKTAKDLAKTFVSLDNLMIAEKEDILKVNDIGQVIADNIYNFFRDDFNLSEINKLFEVGVKIKEPEKTIKNDNIANKTFVLTGTLSMPRAEVENIIESLGGKTSSSVSKNTDYVLAGEAAGSKLDKAKSLGVKIISEEDFKKLIEN